MSYGRELILDLHFCETSFTEENIREFMTRLCDLLEMEAADLHIWGYDSEEEKMEAPEHLAGTSAVQFITTSNITIHCLDKLSAVYLNIFTCGELNKVKAMSFCRNYWKGTTVNSAIVERL